MKSTTRRLLEFVEFVSAAVYLMVLLMLRKRTRRSIIYYHGIQKKDVCRFEKQMVYLAKNCRVVGVSEIGEVNADIRSAVAITFDDAFVSVLENAVPVLKKYGLTAGIFVPTDNLAQPPHWEMPDNCSEKNEIVMSSDQLSKLDKDGFAILSHSVSHPNLTLVDNDRLQSELQWSKNILEEILGHEIVGISYPHGAFDDRVCRLAKKIGYKLGFTIEPTMLNSSTDSLKIGRFAVSPRDSLLKFRLKVNGAYQATTYLRSTKASLFRLVDRKRMLACNNTDTRERMEAR